MIVASSSPVYFLQNCFSSVKFRAKFKVALQRKSISHCESLEIRLFYRQLSSRKRGNLLSVFQRISLKYSNDQRG